MQNFKTLGQPLLVRKERREKKGRYNRGLQVPGQHTQLARTNSMQKENKYFIPTKDYTDHAQKMYMKAFTI